MKITKTSIHGTSDFIFTNKLVLKLFHMDIIYTSPVVKIHDYCTKAIQKIHKLQEHER